MSMKNPAQWRGMRYPDSDLVGLVFRYAKPGRDLPDSAPRAIDVGCGNGRHVRFLNEVGYRAFGIDIDPQMCETARDNGVEVLQIAVEQYRPVEPLGLVLCWGVMMLVPQIPEIVAGWNADVVIADWRTPNNSCFHWPGNVPLPDRPGFVRLNQPGHILHGCEYRSHQLSECQLPGYERIHWQLVVRETADEHHEWWQTVHRRIGRR